MRVQNGENFCSYPPCGHQMCTGCEIKRFDVAIGPPILDPLCGGGGGGGGLGGFGVDGEESVVRKKGEGGGFCEGFQWDRLIPECRHHHPDD